MMDTASDAQATKRKVTQDTEDETANKRSREENVEESEKPAAAENDSPDSKTCDNVEASSSSTAAVSVGAPCENDVGITEYISSHQGFNGVIKQRFSDFLVNEIDSEGNTVHLTNREEPIEEKQAASDPVLTDDQTAELTGLMNSKDKDKNVTIPVGSDKDLRTRIHKAIRENFTNLESATADADGEKVIKVTWRSGKDNRAQKPWPSHHGDYCRFVLYKENKDTMDAVNVIAKMMRLKPGSFAYAGTKDRRAKTCQHVTLYRVPPANLHKLNQRLRGMALGNFSYCKNPLKLGDLSGNHFTVVLRNVTGTDSQIQSAMESLKEHGFINYYGMQRFGTTSVPTHLVGKTLLQGKWSEAIDLILKPRETKGVDDMAAARTKWAKSKDADAALDLLPRRQSIERHLLHGLSKYDKNDLVSALNTIPRNSRLMYVHSYQSFVWNTLLSRRLQKFGLKPVIGDLVIKVSSPKDATPTVITEDNIDQFSLRDVVMPLPGYDVIYPANDVGTWYREMLDDDDMGDMKRKVKDYSLSGDYRHIVVKPQDVTWETTRYDDITQPLVYGDLEKLQGNVNPTKNEEGKFLALILTFSLPSSCYATMALREVLKSDTSVSHQSSLNVS